MENKGHTIVVRIPHYCYRCKRPMISGGILLLYGRYRCPCGISYNLPAFKAETVHLEGGNQAPDTQHLEDGDQAARGVCCPRCWRGLLYLPDPEDKVVIETQDGAPYRWEQSCPYCELPLVCCVDAPFVSVADPTKS